uniref:DUF354 domain-containing protein n=1 Tax=Flavobacterium sp. TaxID=239 RepID=UPI00404A627E
MTYLFYFGHPAQYLFLRATMQKLQEKHKVVILIKTKDILENLIQADGFEYTNILPKTRGGSKFAIVMSLLKRNAKILPFIRKTKPDLMVSTDASIAQLGKMLKIKRISITEDDYDIIKPLADLSYPVTNHILCPKVCGVGKWEHKKIGYDGYMKLGYLHPNVFTPSPEILKNYGLAEKYAIIRLAKLAAFHDFGIKGITYEFLDKIIERLEKQNIQVLISNEATIDSKYDVYLLKINPSDMHHILAQAQMLICDSQSMSVEAAVLGVPSLRYSSFAGKISVLEELEHKYQLTFGIPIGEEQRLLDKLDQILDLDSFIDIFQQRRASMLAEKIDVTAFLVWFLKNYPKSVSEYKNNQQMWPLEVILN